MTKTLTHSTELVVTSCWCGIGLAIPESLYNQARSTQISIYCPLGHSFVFSNTALQRLEAELAKTKAELMNKTKIIGQWAAEYNEVFEAKRGVERQLSATRGVLTKTRKRIANGVCPCCNRHFVNVERHMKGQHPEYQSS